MSPLVSLFFVTLVVRVRVVAGDIDRGSCAESLTSILEQQIATGDGLLDPCRTCIERAKPGPNGSGCKYCPTAGGGRGGQSCYSNAWALRLTRCPAATWIANAASCPRLEARAPVPRAPVLRDALTLTQETSQLLGWNSKEDIAVALKAFGVQDKGIYAREQAGEEARVLWEYIISQQKPRSDENPNLFAITFPTTDQRDAAVEHIKALKQDRATGREADGGRHTRPATRGAKEAAPGVSVQLSLRGGSQGGARGARDEAVDEGNDTANDQQECIAAVIQITKHLIALPFPTSAQESQDLQDFWTSTLPQMMEQFRSFASDPRGLADALYASFNGWIRKAGTHHAMQQTYELVRRKLQVMAKRPQFTAEWVGKLLQDFSENPGRYIDNLEFDMIHVLFQTLVKAQAANKAGVKMSWDDALAAIHVVSAPAKDMFPRDRPISFGETCLILANDVLLPGIEHGSMVQRPAPDARKDAYDKWLALHDDEAVQERMCQFILSRILGKEDGAPSGRAKNECKGHLSRITSQVVTPCREQDEKFVPVSPRYLRVGICGAGDLGGIMGVPRDTQSESLWQDVNKPGWLSPQDPSDFTFGVEHEGSDLNLLNVYRPSWIDAEEWRGLCPPDTQPCMDNYQGCNNPCVPKRSHCESAEHDDAPQTNKMLQVHCASFNKEPAEALVAIARLGVSLEAQVKLYSTLVAKMAQRAVNSVKSEIERGTRSTNTLPPGDVQKQFDADVLGLPKPAGLEPDATEKIVADAVSRETQRVRANFQSSKRYITPDDNPSLKSGVSWANYELFHDLGLPELWRATVTEEVYEDTWELRLPKCEPTVALTMFTISEMQQMFWDDPESMGGYHVHVVFPRPQSSGCDCKAAMRLVAGANGFRDASFVDKQCIRLHANDYSSPTCEANDQADRAGYYLANIAIGAYAILLNDFAALIKWEAAWLGQFMRVFYASTATRILSALTNGDFENQHSPLRQLEAADIHQHNWGAAKNAFIALRTPSVYGSDRVGLEIRGGVYLEPQPVKKLPSWQQVLSRSSRPQDGASVQMALFLVQVVKTLKSFTADQSVLQATLRLSVAGHKQAKGDSVQGKSRQAQGDSGKQQQHRANSGAAAEQQAPIHPPTVLSTFMWEMSTRARSMQWERLRVAPDRAGLSAAVEFTSVEGWDRYGWDTTPRAVASGHTKQEKHPMDLHVMSFVVRVIAQAPDTGPAECMEGGNTKAAAAMSGLFGKSIAPVLVKLVSNKMQAINGPQVKDEYNDIIEDLPGPLKEEAKDVAACLAPRSDSSAEPHACKDDHFRALQSGGRKLDWGVLGSLLPLLRKCYLSVVEAVSFAAVTTRRLATLEQADPTLFKRVTMPQDALELGARRPSAYPAINERSEQAEEEVVRAVIGKMSSWGNTAADNTNACLMMPYKKDAPKESCAKRLEELILECEPSKLREIM